MTFRSSGSSFPSASPPNDALAMSTQSANRKRAQKHKNAVGWKVDKFHTDPKTKLVKNLVVVNCCEKCTGVIEWKVR